MTSLERSRTVGADVHLANTQTNHGLPPASMSPSRS
eukprot:CAMPEP_0117581324 /NCGR_PEP_ID=MMETSP0784-20121206/65757_1 /TAXON_ID=39447 /ORGANISM="" /LENGTH=35 /DNA_ID= /DNA_START= /DNA_END= /DNA_ORIENTATION=